MKKLYSIKGEDADECYSLEYFQENLRDDDLRTKLILEVWEPKTGTGTFWCGYHGEGYEAGEGACGVFECREYAPRNGKSGRCRWHQAPYHPTGKTVTITK